MLKTSSFVAVIYASIVIVDSSYRVCTPLKNLPIMKRLLTKQSTTSYLVFKKFYFLQCVQTCMKSSPCKAIGFDLFHGQCSLYVDTHPKLGFYFEIVTTAINEWPIYLAGACSNHTCPNNTLCEETTSGSYLCKVFGCLIPANLSQKLKSYKPFLEIGYEVRNPCSEGLYTRSTVSCLTSGYWSTFQCMPHPRNCSEVRKCNSVYGDGEYWLRHSPGAGYETIKIYCHGMSSNNPAEYITLFYDNFSKYSDSDFKYCNGSLDIRNIFSRRDLGESKFYKIKVNITSLEIDRKDQSFSQSGLLLYAAAQECTVELSSCPARTQFKIDLRNTSFIVSNRSEMNNHSNGSGIESISWESGNQIIRGECGASPTWTCGGCSFEKIYLEVNDALRPDIQSAVIPECGL